MRKFLSSIVMLGIVMATLIGCASPATPTTAPAAAPTTAPAVAKPAGLPATITVGVNSENPPWVFMKDGKMTGFEVDMIEEFAKREGVTIEYKSAPFATVLTGVQSGQWDIAMSSIWVTQARLGVMDFSNPYYDSQIGMMTPKTNGITSFDQMKGKTFGSDTGSANEAWLKSAESQYGPFTEKSYNAWLDAVLDLQAGRLDGVVVDAPIAQYYIQQHPDSNLAMPLYIPNFSAGQALAFKKGSAIRDIYNTVQGDMIKDGTLKAIFVKWFGVQPPTDSCTVNICAPYLPNEKPTPTK